MRKYFLTETITTVIIFSFLVISIIPNVQSYFTKWEPKASNIVNNKDFYIHPERFSDSYTNSLNWLTFNNKHFRDDIYNTNFHIKSTRPLMENKGFRSTSDGNTLYVGGSGPYNYTSIQYAINDANDGDTVFVYDDSAPYYVRSSLFILKSIKLIGENKETTIIDQSRESPIFTSSIIDIYSNADGVTISGFTIRKSGDFWFDYGIQINSNNNTISDNIIENNYMGIVINGYETFGHNNTISNNIIKSNLNGGLLFYKSTNNIIENNTFSDNIGGLILDTGANNNNILDNVFYNDGIWIADANENIFSNNMINDKPLLYLEDEIDKVIDNTDAGQVILVGCNNITVKDNELTNICTGVVLSKTDNCFISENTIGSNTKGGIFLISSNGNNISTNTLSNNNMGIIISSSYNNIITGNIIKNSEQESINILESYNNLIFGNNFSDNRGLTLDYCDNNNISYNTFNNDGIAMYTYYQNTVLDNLVNGKPLIFLVGENDKVLEDAGQIILVSCYNITIQNQEIFNVPIGLTIVDTSNSNILNNKITNSSDYSILLVYSYNNNISLNIISKNDYCGIGLFENSNNNNIHGDKISLCNFFGIMITSSNDNIISNNEFKRNGGSKRVENGLGIFLYSSSTNKVEYNNFILNIRDAFFNDCKSTRWIGNYWNRPRILPKLILGEKFTVFPLPIINILNLRFNIDSRPAKKPNVIP